MDESSRSAEPDQLTRPPDGFGVIYLAMGRPYLAQALSSALSLRITDPEVPYAIVTNVTESPPELQWFTDNDHWIHVDVTTADNRRVKTAILDHTPFERTLWVDADTIVRADLGLIDYSLGFCEVMARPYLERITGKRGGQQLLDSSWSVGETFMCNSGVVAFRRSAGTDRFFAEWQRAFEALGLPIDQPAFVPAIYTSGVHFLPLPRRFNEGAPSALETDDIAILHYKRRGDRTTRRLVEDVAVRLFGDDPELRAEVRKALEPGKKKLRQRAYRRSRNQDRFRPSIVAPIRREAEARGWL